MEHLKLMEVLGVLKGPLINWHVAVFRLVGLFLAKFGYFLQNFRRLGLMQRLDSNCNLKLFNKY